MYREQNDEVFSAGDENGKDIERGENGENSLLLNNNSETVTESVGDTKKNADKPASKVRSFKDKAVIVVIVAACVCMALLEYLPIHYSSDGRIDYLIRKALPLYVGSVAIVLLMVRNGTGLFKKPQKLLFMIPCLIVAVDNFPFHAYFKGLTEITQYEISKWILFSLYCLGVGIFEECIFRGILFPLLAEKFSKDRKGFLKTYVYSSVIFGCMHILNILAGENPAMAILQAAYSTLIGGLCAYAMIKTKNIISCIFTHGLYDFCGLILTEQGLGNGSVVLGDIGTVITMAVVGVVMGVFVFVTVLKVKEEERIELYKRLGFGVK